ncbi:ATP/GTP-binding protein, partial [Aldersonia kunmingensis]|uniref:ATP/GTP-binding protein n=1 Tax=Aldersonia kunmingensis TaxID=408066 RepID=UPI0008360942
EGLGEYSHMASLLRANSLRFRAGHRSGGARINLLDPVIALRLDERDTDERPAGQLALVKAVLVDTMMQRGLSETDHAAIARSLELVTGEARDAGYDPTIAHLWRRLLDPQPGDGDPFGAYAPEYERWGRDCGLALKRLAEDELSGLVDGPTSADVRAALEHPFVHTDISALPEDGHALRIVMTVMNTWLANLLADRSRAHRQTVLGIEEGWHIADGSTGKLVRANMKLSRGTGLSTWTAFHHLADFPPDSPARALMRESSIVYLFGQERAVDAQECAHMWDLPTGSVETLMSLGRGEALLKVGSEDPILLRHIRSDIEATLTNTDSAILGHRT